MSPAGPGQGARRYDAVVVGSGVAGCATALRLARAGVRVALATKDELGVSTSAWAQGGVAAALPDGDDRPEDHLADTLRAGADLCDPTAARVLVEGAPAAIAGLLEVGTRLDRGPGGELARSREGGHGRARVVHAGGVATGAEVIRALVAAVTASEVDVLPGWAAGRLLVEGGRCVGVSAAWAPPGAPGELRTGAVVLATGGAGQLFARTTNPPGATGDGVALALRAGIPVADLEMVQFHPTALAVEVSPRPLLSEALRGEGALLVGRHGERFVDELQPRDIVARAMVRQMVVDGTDHVHLDARPVEGFNKRFPTLAAALGAVGLDAEVDLLPVAPAAHFVCGGVLTDLDGATGLPGCYAVGEVACTGVHGANRLASNSLLEGLVFGARVAAAVAGGVAGPSPTGALGPLVGSVDEAALPVRALPSAWPASLGAAPSSRAVTAGPSVATRERLAAIGSSLQSAMSAGAGVERDAASLDSAARGVDEAARALAGLASGPDEESDVRRAAVELAHLVQVAGATVALAVAREESRGAHFRLDHPETKDAWRCRLALVGERADPGGPGGRGGGNGGSDAP